MEVLNADGSDAGPKSSVGALDGERLMAVA